MYKILSEIQILNRFEENNAIYINFNFFIEEELNIFKDKQNKNCNSFIN
jgi:hypothetical protein